VSTARGRDEEFIPFLGVTGTLKHYAFGDASATAVVSSVRAQVERDWVVGTVVRAGDDTALYLGRVDGNDYFVHLDPGTVPSQAEAFDFERQIWISGKGGHADQRLLVSMFQRAWQKI
jgi:hypothetical protein